MDNNNKRTHKRLECSLEGKMLIQGKYRSAEVLDINEKGLRVSCGMNLAPGETAQIEISGNSNNTYQFVCKVVWSTIFLSGYMMGLVILGDDIENVRGILSELDLKYIDLTEKKENEHKDAYESIFESYSEEIFLRQVKEFVEYIKKNDPNDGIWAEKLSDELKEIIERVLNEFEKWTE